MRPWIPDFLSQFARPWLHTSSISYLASAAWVPESLGTIPLSSPPVSNTDSGSNNDSGANIDSGSNRGGFENSSNRQSGSNRHSAEQRGLPNSGVCRTAGSVEQRGLPNSGVCRTTRSAEQRDLPNSGVWTPENPLFKKLEKRESQTCNFPYEMRDPRRFSEFS